VYDAGPCRGQKAYAHTDVASRRRVHGVAAEARADHAHGVGGVDARPATRGRGRPPRPGIPARCVRYRARSSGAEPWTSDLEPLAEAGQRAAGVADDADCQGTGHTEVRRVHVDLDQLLSVRSPPVLVVRRVEVAETGTDHVDDVGLAPHRVRGGSEPTKAWGWCWGPWRVGLAGDHGATSSSTSSSRASLASPRSTPRRRARRAVGAGEERGGFVELSVGRPRRRGPVGGRGQHRRRPGSPVSNRIGRGQVRVDGSGRPLHLPDAMRRTRGSAPTTGSERLTWWRGGRARSGPEPGRSPATR